MNYLQLFNELEREANPVRAIQMSAYMRNRFSFLGIPHPQLAALSRPYLKEAAKESHIDWNFVSAFWEKSYREAQYIAIDYLVKVVKKMEASDLAKIMDLIETKSWWDTVDHLSKVTGMLVERYPQLILVMIDWSRNDNIWIRRVAILFQLMYREKTNTAVLEQILANNRGSGEFFIDKAMGWILRQYSKTNPLWVRNYIDNNRSELSKLTLREAAKYI